MKCRLCDTQMSEGKAIQQTFTAGMPDFPGDNTVSTFSAGGPGLLVDCLKCSSCGHSVAK